MDALQNGTKKHTWFFLTLILLGAARFPLIFSGHFYWIDELRYFNAFAALHEFGNSHITEGIAQLFNAHGRPGYMVFSLIPAGIQLLLQKFHLIFIDNPNFFSGIYASANVTQNFNPHFFDITAAFNWLVSLAILIVIYRIYLTATQKACLAAIGTFIYGTLANSTIYIRHFFPYDLSLFLLLIVFLQILETNQRGENSGQARAIVWGILSAVALLVYSAYSLLFMVIFILVCYLSRKRLTTILLFLLSFTSVFLLTEGASRLAGVSFFKNSLELSGSVIQGSFQEGFIFLPKYLMSVEGITGLILLILLAAFYVFFLYRQSRFVTITFIGLLATYLLYACLCVFMHRMVFYGRIIHIYFPFIIWAAILCVQQIPRPEIRKGAAVVLAGIALVQFCFFLTEYIPQKYPLDLRYKILSFMPPGSTCNAFDSQPFDSSRLKKCMALSVNLDNMHPIPQYYSLVPQPPNMTLITSVRHPVSIKAYQFEGYSISSRERLKTRNYQMRIYVNSILYNAFAKKKNPQ